MEVKRMDDYHLFEIKPNSSIIEHFNNHPTCIDKEFNFILQKTELRSIESNPDRFKTALLDKNKTKNRYSNVLPYEDTRVKLNIDDLDLDENDDPEEVTDYINASFLSGGNYICTQGPLLNTINDFWKMIWEQRSNVIVMLTKEEENHKIKCDKYWPDEGKIQCGRYQIKFENKITIPEISIRREFTLTDLKTNQSISVKHFQYTTWPDHGTPVSTTNFLKFVGHVDHEVRTGPITVHCSAGIGRSGTFCVIHSVVSNYIKEYEEKKLPPSLNLPKTVVEFRNERAGMVQTRDQYRFCYLAISETMSATIKKDQRKRKGLSYSYSSIPITPNHDNDNATTTAFQ
ncbi:protein tyrosine phosphatase [Tieghemostelium lacteum]|uniref:Protein tyrosine phosphatase n=1 Tax=Tieghemostelium lacteum TaxID=361077 RepID=A0A151ZK76_TIELA|nr:protein tyrosine phosphatase [Tieghemostelium lacteum]|eukprot:KYQ94383.1 protein tyrosine phosphatase [Tieghemostelium lacteum]